MIAMRKSTIRKAGGEEQKTQNRDKFQSKILQKI